MEWNRELICKVRGTGCPFNLAFLNFVGTLYLEAEDEVEENLTASQAEINLNSIPASSFHTPHP